VDKERPLRHCGTVTVILHYPRVFPHPRIYRASFQLSSKLKRIVPGRNTLPSHANFTGNVTEINAVETINNDLEHCNVLLIVLHIISYYVYILKKKLKDVLFFFVEEILIQLQLQIFKKTR